jgi:hypothetical protein
VLTDLGNGSGVLPSDYLMYCSLIFKVKISDVVAAASCIRLSELISKSNSSPSPSFLLYSQPLWSRRQKKDHLSLSIAMADNEGQDDLIHHFSEITGASPEQVRVGDYCSLSLAGHLRSLHGSC